MKKYLASTVAVLLVLAPAGFAFADETVNLNTGLNIGVESHDQGEIQDESGDNGASTDIEASSSAHVESDNGGKMENDTEATTTETDMGKSRGDNNNQGENGGHGGIFSFFAWLFSHPASTTVGDLKNEIQASTSASTSADFNFPHGRALGFWARFFSFFGFGE